MEIQHKTSANLKDVLSETKMETLVEVLAEGFLYLAEKGLLEKNIGMSSEVNASVAVLSNVDKPTEMKP